MCSALSWQWTVKSRIWDVAVSKQRVMMAHFHPENIMIDIDNASWEAWKARHWCERETGCSVFVNPLEPGLAFPHPAHLGCIFGIFGIFCSFSPRVPPVCCSCGPQWALVLAGSGRVLPAPSAALVWAVTGGWQGEFQKHFLSCHWTPKGSVLLAKSFGFSIKNGNVWIQN